MTDKLVQLCRPCIRRAQVECADSADWPPDYAMNPSGDELLLVL